MVNSQKEGELSGGNKGNVIEKFYGEKGGQNRASALGKILMVKALPPRRVI